MIRLPRLAMAYRVWYRNARVFARFARTTMALPFVDPLYYFVALGFGLGAFIPSIGNLSYSEFIAPGMCASATLFAASYETTFALYWRMHDARIHDNLLATPIEPEDIVLGELLWAATRATFYATAFVIVIAALGYVHSPAAIALPLFLFLGGLAYGALGMTCTTLIPDMDYFSFYFTLVVNPMFLFGGIFFPSDSLPGWAQTVGWFIPTHHLVEIARALVNGGAVSAVLWNAVWLIGATVLIAIVPLWQFRRRLGA